jgi:hypothetical protein
VTECQRADPDWRNKGTLQLLLTVEQAVSEANSKIRKIFNIVEKIVE